MLVRDYANLNVVCCEPDAPIAEVAALMRRHHVGDVVVVDNQQDGARIPIGIVTDRDILVETLALDVDPKMFSAAELMSSPVTTVQEDASLNEALGVMRGKKIRRLPVVNRAGGLFGMITSDDVINLIASELAMVAGLRPGSSVEITPIRRGLKGATVRVSPWAALRARSSAAPGTAKGMILTVAIISPSTTVR